MESQATSSSLSEEQLKERRRLYSKRSYEKQHKHLKEPKQCKQAGCNVVFTVVHANQLYCGKCSVEKRKSRRKAINHRYYINRGLRNESY